MLWAPDITVEVFFLPTSDGGKTRTISGQWYGCPLGIDGAYFDARFDLTELGSIAPGSTVRLRAKLLDPAAVRHFASGREFSLWEGRTIGTGRVLERHSDT
jgi:hypothetical protein